MLFNTMQYAFFLLFAFIVYYVLPYRVRYIWLCGISYYFYSCWNRKYTALIFLISLITYVSGLIIDRFRDNVGVKKATLIISLILNFGTLAYFKYLNFFITSINGVFKGDGAGVLHTFDIILPVGISFFIFQATGYVIDVYKKDADVEKNPIRYALFVSFFPQLVAGPIERSKNLMQQLQKKVTLDGDNIRYGLLYILFGLWQKIVIADNVAIIVNDVYANYADRTGTQIVLAVILFGIEIYCDFGGYSNIAIGSARLFGINLMRNFNSPYMAVNPVDFWKRWHISLTSWFRDYVYIPLGGNRRGEVRKYINTIIVFALSGLWHGAGYNFIFWGFLNGIYMIIGNYILRRKEVKKNNCFFVWIKRIITFVLIDFTWMFFRADNMGHAFSLMRRVVERPGIKGMLAGCDLELFEMANNLWVIVVGLVILLVVGILREKYKDIAAWFFGLREPFRWIMYLLFIMMIVAWGVYGKDFAASEFIYFQF